MSLVFEGIRHRYGADEVLRDVSFPARPGEVTCLLGPSGGGKSTLLRLAAGLEAVQAGAIRLDGDVLSAPGQGRPPEQRPVGLVFQDHVLFPHLTARANVAFGLRGRDQRERRRLVDEALAAVGLSALADRYPHTLSGGEQQRVALARALAPAPRVMLLDEPFANVDVTLRRRLREDTRQTLRQAGGIALVVTHDPEEALEVADRIAILHHGRIAQVGSPSDIWRRPAAAIVAASFGQAQHLRGRMRGGAVETAFGPVPESGARAAGAEVDVIVRPAGVDLRKAAGESAAIVRDVRFLGDRYLVLAEADGEVLRANVAELPDLRVGDRVVARFRAADTFVYERAVPEGAA